MASMISIGITAYNAAGTIERAVTAALAQTWRPIEIIAVDDLSSDSTPEILERLAATHPELRVIRRTENGGVAAARNDIVSAARGEFLAFFDDDDVSAPERLQVQHDRIVSCEADLGGAATVICHSARAVIYPGMPPRLERTMGESATRPPPRGTAVARRVLLGTPLEDGYGACPTCSQMARVETYRTLGGFDPAFRRSEDTEFNLRLARAGGHFAGVATPLVTQHMTLTSDKSLADEYRYTVMLIEKHRDFFDSDAQYAFTRRWLDARRDWQRGKRLSFAARMLQLLVSFPLLTVQRLQQATQGVALNRAFRRFHTTGVHE